MRLLLILTILGAAFGCTSPSHRDPSDRDGIIRDEERQERVSQGIAHAIFGLIDGKTSDERDADAKQAESELKEFRDRTEAQANDPDRFRNIRGL